VHANSARDALLPSRHDGGDANLNLPERANPPADRLGPQYRDSHEPDGGRHQEVTSITELTGMEGEVISIQDIFVSSALASAPREGHGPFPATGIRPKAASGLTSSGFPLPMNMFDHVQVV